MEYITPLCIKSREDRQITRTKVLMSVYTHASANFGPLQAIKELRHMIYLLLFLSFRCKTKIEWQ